MGIGCNRNYFLYANIFGKVPVQTEYQFLTILFVQKLMEVKMGKIFPGMNPGIGSPGTCYLYAGFQDDCHRLIQKRLDAPGIFLALPPMIMGPEKRQSYEVAVIQCVGLKGKDNNQYLVIWTLY